jgi:hypothetical protein
VGDARLGREFLLSGGIVSGLLLCGALLGGCAPQVGSQCVLNTDCGTSGSLLCDNSQPGGYCTQFNCSENSCPNQAACVEFLASLPGCPYDDYRSPARTGRTFCLKHCQQDSDCRDMYICSNPTQAPWYGAILDDNQNERVCIVSPDQPLVSIDASGTNVCSPSGPKVPAIQVDDVGIGSADGSDDAVDSASDGDSEGEGGGVGAGEGSGEPP